MDCPSGKVVHPDAPSAWATENETNMNVPVEIVSVKFHTARKIMCVQYRWPREAVKSKEFPAPPELAADMETWAVNTLEKWFNTEGK